jgi:hypothetical protein
MRRIASLFALVAAGLSLLAGAGSWWADRTIFDQAGFVAKVDSTFADPVVRAGIVQRLKTDAPLAAALNQLDPRIVDASVDDPEFRGVFRDMAARLRGFVTDPTAADVTITLGNYGAILKRTAERFDPQLAARIDTLGLGTGPDVQLLVVDRASLPGFWDGLMSLRGLTAWFFGAGAVLLICGVWLDPRHDRAVAWFGALTALSSAGVALLTWLLPATIASGTAELLAAEQQIAAALLRSFVLTAAGAAVVGSVLALLGLLAGRWSGNPRARQAD